jgi:hypothetical protein
MALSSDLALPCRTNADSCERRRTLSCWSYWGGSIEARRTLSPQLLIRGADPGVFLEKLSMFGRSSRTSPRFSEAISAAALAIGLLSTSLPT